MLSAKEIANFLQSGLDNIGKELPDPFEFSILAECGRGYDGNKVNGVVRTVSSEFAPYKAGYKEVKYVFAVELFVSGPEDFYFLSVNDIVNKFMAEHQSDNVTFENGKGVVTFTPGAPKGYKIEYGVGEGVPLSFTVNVTYTENGVSSGDKHWFLDGVEIPFLSESVTVEREGISRKVYTEVYSKILLTGQTKFYSFRIPYESETFKSLQAEILQTPGVDKVVHTLSYYDGAAFTKENPYIAKVSIYRSAGSSSTKPNASAYEITFTDVWNAENQPLKYELALIDFPFDMQGDDTRYFNSVPEQSAYFEEKAAASTAPFIEIQAPNLDGLVITKQVYKALAPNALSQFDYASKNYAVIKVESADTEQPTKYFYYFIENSSIGADGQVLVDLKMDTVQTYFFNPDITFSDCLIERAHLNRFVPVEGDPDRVKFVTDPASKIYNSEEGLNFPKRLVQRDKLKLRFTGNDEVDKWLNENVAYWVYIFIDPTKEYTVKKFDMISNSKSTVKSPEIGYPIDIKGAVGCICYPIYKNHRNSSLSATNHNVIVIKSKTIDAIPQERAITPIQGAQEILEALNEDIKSFYYNYKLSIYPPFDTSDDITVEDDNLVIDATTERDGAYCYFGKHSQKVILTGGAVIRAYYGLIISVVQNNKFLSSFAYELPENAPIPKKDITKPQPPNLKFNPKLNSQNFKDLIITTSSGDEFAYDVQKLGQENIEYEYTEPIQPEITKYYLRVKGGTGLYEDGTDENYMGIVGSNDTSLLFRNSDYSSFLANNKNFFLQSNMKIVSGAVKSAVGIASQAASKNVVGAVTSGITASIDTATAFIDRGMTIDNLKNAPEQLKNANGNIIFNLFTTDLGLYVEKHEALEGDLQTANHFMDLYGFTFSAIDNIKNHVHTRKFHNYIKAQLQSINGNLNNVARADLRQRFANGVRFWNSDAVDYSKENYELWL